MSKEKISIDQRRNEHGAIQFILLAIVFLVLLTLNTGCGSAAAIDENKDEPAAKEPDLVAETVKVEKQKHTVEIVVPASVEGYEMALLKSRVEGYVKKVNADIGDMVVPMTDQDENNRVPLAELEVPELLAEKARLVKMQAKADADKALRDAEVKQAEAKRGETAAMVALRESEKTRIQGLVQRGALNAEKLNEADFALQSAKAMQASVEADVLAAKAMVDSAEADIGVAAANVAKADAMISYLKIDAPFKGVITERMVDPGAYVEPASNGGSPLFRIESVEKVRVVMHIPVGEAIDLNKGDKVVLSGVLGKPDKPFPGKIDRLAKSFNRQTRMMRAEVDLENKLVNGQRELLPGDYGKATITVQDESIDTVHATAVGDDENGSFIVEVDDDDICYVRRIVIKSTKKGKDGLDVVGIEHADGSPITATYVIDSNPEAFMGMNGKKLHAVSRPVVSQSKHKSKSVDKKKSNE